MHEGPTGIGLAFVGDVAGSLRLTPVWLAGQPGRIPVLGRPAPRRHRKINIQSNMRTIC
jgi:hypothetical protein